MKKCAMLLILAALALPVMSQNERDDNWKVPRKTVEVGILMSLDLDYLKVDRSNWDQLGINNQLNALETKNNLGFSLGILSRFNLNHFLAIVPQAILGFHNAELSYDLENQSDHNERLEPVTIEFPIHIEFTQDKGKRISPSVTLGGRFLFDLTDREDVDFKTDLKRNDFAIDLGTGLEIKMHRFKMKPQLQYSLGLVNLKDSDQNLFNAALQSINRDRISLRLLFYN